MERKGPVVRGQESSTDEYLIDQTAIPYRDLVNILLDHLQYQAYSVKDRIAKGLADLFA